MPIVGSKFPIDLRRVGGYITNNNLWDKPLNQWDTREIEDFIRAAVFICGTWPPDMRLLINWLRETELPEEPFILQYTQGGHPFLTVDNAKEFRQQLLQEISYGPYSGRAYHGALQSDLRRVYAVFGNGTIDDEVPF